MFCNPSLLRNANSNDTTTPFMKGNQRASDNKVLKQIPANKEVDFLSMQGKVEILSADKFTSRPCLPIWER